MTEILLKGKILFQDGWGEGSVLIDDGRIVEVSASTGPDLTSEVVVEGLIFPGLLDMHAHLGDYGARGPLPSLRGAVFSGGMKDDFLSSSTEMQMISSISNSLKELNPGVTLVLDYREGGIRGVEYLRKAAESGGPMVCPLGRVIEGDNSLDLLEGCCGIGQPFLVDDLEPLRKMVKAKGRIFSIHASELFREDIDTLLKLHPDQVVHMTSGTEDDWSALSGASIPVAVCPRSNHAFGIEVPLTSMLLSGLDLSLGTDNSMSVMQDMFREMEYAWILLRSNGMEGSEASRMVFDMAIGRLLKGRNIWELLPRWTKWWESGWPAKGDPAHLFSIKRPPGDTWIRDPWSQIVRFTDRSMVSYSPSFKSVYMKLFK